MSTWTIAVGWTDSRPIVPDQHVTHVTVSVPSALSGLEAENEATWIAAAMVAANRRTEMVTSTTVLGQPSRRVPLSPERRAEILEAFTCASA